MNLYLVINEKGRAVVAAETLVEARELFSGGAVVWLGIAQAHVRGAGVICQQFEPRP
jgi:hypothetical protein